MLMYLDFWGWDGEVFIDEVIFFVVFVIWYSWIRKGLMYLVEMVLWVYNNI